MIASFAAETAKGAVVTIALKEWASVVRALELGRVDVLLRKGGLDEGRGGFGVPHASFLLFPTYFHQQIEGVKPEHRDLVEAALASEPTDGTITISSRADVIATRIVANEAELDAVFDRQPYSRVVAVERLRAVHGKALFAIEVRVTPLDEPLVLATKPAYGGCKSWIEV